MKPSTLIGVDNQGRQVMSNILLQKGTSGADEDLTAFRNNETNTYTTRWNLTFKERLSVLFGGSIWLSVIGFGHPPVRLEVTNPTDLLEDGTVDDLENWRREQ